jgi:hypothetical protein
MFRNDSQRASIDGRLREAQAVRACAGHGEKHKAGLYSATIRAQARNFANRRIGWRINVRNKLAQRDHQFPLEGVLT